MKTQTLYTFPHIPERLLDLFQRAQYATDQTAAMTFMLEWCALWADLHAAYVKHIQA